MAVRSFTTGKADDETQAVRDRPGGGATSDHISETRKREDAGADAEITEARESHLVDRERKAPANHSLRSPDSAALVSRDEAWLPPVPISNRLGAGSAVLAAIREVAQVRNPHLRTNPPSPVPRPLVRASAGETGQAAVPAAPRAAPSSWPRASRTLPSPPCPLPPSADRSSR